MNKRFHITIVLFGLGLFLYGFQANVHQNINKAFLTNQNPAVNTAGEDTLENVQLVDHHTHIFTPKVREYLIDNVDGLSSLPPLGLKQLLGTLKQDSIPKAAVLSNAYFFSNAGSTSADNFNDLQSVNDRVANAVARHPEKLLGFFGINPLSDSAIVEIERNADRKTFTGIKLHLANSGVDLRNPTHVRRLGKVFDKANALDLGIVIHMRTQESPYGRKDAAILIDSVLSKAPDIPIQIAHMAGWSGYDEATDGALSVFADRISNNNLRENIYFDLSAVIKPVNGNNGNAGKQSPAWYPQKRYERLTAQLRKIGMDRILFGTDWPEWTPRDYKSDIIEKLPLTASELRQIFANRAPWFE